jgi:hypothetical protein
METCKTCKHWGRRVERFDGMRLKSCDAPLIRYGYHVSEDEVTDNGALVEDDEGWGMVTGPEFGCLHWEVK